MEQEIYALPPDRYVLRVLGGRLKVLRKQRNLTQAQLAEQLGVEHPWVSKVEGGNLSPSPGRLRALCVVLNVDPAVLLML